MSTSVAYIYNQTEPLLTMLFDCPTQAITEPGENWIDETYERKVELGPLPGWELPLDWTSPDTTAEKKATLRRKLSAHSIIVVDFQVFPVDIS